MNHPSDTLRRRHALQLSLSAALCLAFAPLAGQAQTGGTFATPYYSAEHVLQGLYAHRLPPLASAFRTEADR